MIIDNINMRVTNNKYTSKTIKEIQDKLSEIKMKFWVKPIDPMNSDCINDEKYKNKTLSTLSSSFKILG